MGVDYYFKRYFCFKPLRFIQIIIDPKSKSGLPKYKKLNNLVYRTCKWQLKN